MSRLTLPCKARACLAAALFILGLPLQSIAGTTDISTVPLPTYAIGTTVDIKPNILMVLDDSGSMSWNYLPDWANDTPPNYSSLPTYISANSAFNGVAYNPAITYSPPITFTSGGAKDTGTYPSMTGGSAATGANTGSTLPNWKSVPVDGFGVQSAGHTDLTNNATFNLAVAGEYCDSPALTNCTTTAAATGNYQYPAPLRWCSDQALTTCRALNDGTYNVPKIAGPMFATITINTASSAVVTGITVGGKQILSGSTTSTSTTSSVASGIVTKVNACTKAISGNCTIVGYSASASSNVVTIYAPAPLTSTTPAVSNTGTMTSTQAAFASPKIPLANFLGGGGTQSTSAVPGSLYFVTITSTVNSYPYPGTASKAATRTDCAGSTCTFNEEMTNYANWYAYFQTRMQMMKTATSRAFAVLDTDADITAGNTHYRVGFMTINNNTGSAFVNITDFNAAQKYAWFTKLFTSIPNNSTPLREALSKAGRLYGGRYNGSSLNGVTVTDPLQYSCQRNYTILSTDGFWNGNAGYKLDGSTAVGNQDAGLPRPYNDGGSSQNQSATSNLQQTITTQTAQLGTLQKQTSQAQKRTNQLQVQTSTLQSQTSSLQASTATLQVNTGTLQKQTLTLQSSTGTLMSTASALQQQTGTLQARTSSNSGNTWTAWGNVATCTADNSGGSRTQCQYALSAWTNVGTCTVVNGSAGPTNYTIASSKACRYLAGTATAVGSCTVVAPSPGPTSYTVGTATTCAYTYAAATNVASCTVVAESAGPNYTVGTSRTCTYNTSAFAAAASCNALAPSPGPTNFAVGNAVNCQYSYTGFSNAGAACTVVAESPGPNYTVGTSRQCQYTAWTSFAAVGSCTVATQGAGPTYSNTTARQCQYTSYGAWSNVASCTAAAQSPGPTTFTVGTATNCQYTAWSGWSNAAGTCTVAAQSAGPAYSGPATQCQYAGWTPWVGAQSCPAAAMSPGPTTYSVLVATGCQTIVTSAYANAASCSVTAADVSGNSTQCQYSFAVAAPTSTCSPAYSAGNYTNASVYSSCVVTVGAATNVSACTTVSAYDVNGQKTACAYTAWTSWMNVTACAALAQSASSPYIVGTARKCQALTSGGTSDTLSDVAAYYYNTDLRSATATGVDLTGTCTGPIISPATTANDLCADNVPASGRDNNTKQHMTTSTLGLGAQGSMVKSNYENNLSGQRTFVSDYWSQQSGDFYAVANGSTANTASGICPWMSTGSTCTWSTPSSDSQNNIDDLWHAAVNGRGTYFSATDPQSLADSLKSALSAIVNTPRPGTAAAAASSNPNITSSDNFVFSSSYKSVDWYGELIMQRLGSDGTLGTQQWSAMQNMDCTSSPWRANYGYLAAAAFSQGGVCYVVNSDYTSGTTFDGTAAGSDGAFISVMTTTPGSRTIYLPGGGASSGLTTFTWANLTAAQQAYFSVAALTYVDANNGLTQFCTVGGSCLTAANQTSAAGSTLVSFLAGDRSNEGTYFRLRKHMLGDIVSSEARYVKQPLQGYTDGGYPAFKASLVNRTAMVYVGANDGMLHAFNALTGVESWAFIPSAVLPTLYQLADSDYANKHRYFVDGTPEVGDICPNAPGGGCSVSQWKTIITGGFNDGAKAYYALDITDPAAPKLLWEFTDATLDLSYSNPRITKLKDGTWVVIIASGYNNADGVGRVYVLNASTGALIRTISTATGTAATPSGLAKLAARAPTSATDNTVNQVYGGDLLGNVWRFDVNGDIGTTGYDAQLLVTLKNAGGTVQPITGKPTVASVNNFPLIMVGTGRYLGITDLSDTTTYSMYAIIDRLGTTTLTTPRQTLSGFVQQTLFDGFCPSDAPSTLCTQGEVVRTVSSNSVDWSVNNGWYIDFLLGGERSVTDPTLALGTLVFTTIKPQSSSSGTVSACTGTDTAVTATSYVYYLDFLTGGAVTGTKNVVGNLLCTCVATRPSVVRTQTGNVEAIIRTSGGGTGTGTDMGQTSRQDLPYDPGTSSMRRVSWRDLNGQ